MDHIVEFLRKRCVPKSQLDKLSEDKIDEDAIKCMSDEELAAYLPARGDRLALRSFHNTRKTETKKQKLFDNLRQKMKLRNKKIGQEEPEEEGSRRKHLDGNKNASKLTRKLELGWIHEGKQVRKRNGGGTRNLEFSKSAKKSDILDKCKELFFPDGTAKGLNLKDLSLEVLDFKETPFPSNVTVGELYDEVKMGILRFYLSSTLKDDHTSDTSSLSLPDPGMFLTEEQTDSSTMMQSTSLSLPDPEICQAEEKPCSSSTVMQTRSLSFPDQEVCQAEEQLDHTTLIQNFQVPSENQSGEGSAVYFEHTASSTIPSSPASFTINSGHAECQQFMHQQPLYACIGYQSSPAAIMVPEESIPGILIQTFDSSSPCTALTAQTNPENVELTALQHTEEFRDRSPISPHHTKPDELTVHRVNIIEEMVNYFKNKDILNTEITFRFIGEKGSDQKGVSREVYTAFWTDFLTGEAEGEESRVPAINTKWQEEEWNSVGRILLKGLTDHAVFPLQMNKAFVISLIHGEEKVDPEMLLNSFLTFICHADKDLVLRVLANGVNEEIKDEFIDLLDRFGCKTIPHEKEQIKCQMIQIAHNQLIQKPKYALDKMKDACQSNLKELFPTVANIEDIYASKKPTTKRVLSILEASPTTPDESRAFGYLQQFIRAQNDTSLRKFLRFFTGADTMCVGKITVSFVNLTGIARRVIAHTCGPTIELPSTYQSYPEFRRELENQLACEESFKMDIA